MKTLQEELEEMTKMQRLTPLTRFPRPAYPERKPRTLVGLLPGSGSPPEPGNHFILKPRFGPAAYIQPDAAGPRRRRASSLHAPQPWRAADQFEEGWPPAATVLIVAVLVLLAIAVTCIPFLEMPS